MAGYITGNNIYYIFFTTLVVLALLALLSLFVSYQHVGYLQEIKPKEGVKCETVVLKIQIYNDYFIPLPHIEVEYDLPDEKLNLYSSKTRFGVSSVNRVISNQDVYCKYRGKWKVGIKKLRVYDMFGLFHITLDFNKNPKYRMLDLIIKPRIVKLNYLPLPFKENASSQNAIRKLTLDTAEVSEIRKYVEGDILKKIHWKLSSSKQELLVKSYSLSFDLETYLYLDCSAHDYIDIEAIEIEDMIAESATAVANYLLQACLPTKFIIMDNERTEMQGRSPDDFWNFYENISNISFDYDFSFFELFSNEISSITRTNSIFIITHYISTKGFDTLIYLREASININVFLIEPARKKHDKKTRFMISELISNGVTIIHLAPGDDLNLKIKEQANEKKTF